MQQELRIRVDFPYDSLKVQQIKTIDSYSDIFEEFLHYYDSIKIEAITETMIIDFLRYLVNDRRVSTSFQNQSINAIKFYYERVCGGIRKVYL